MCGIAGWFSADAGQQPGDAAALDAMVKALAHRGPDGNGTWFDTHAALGHTRLAIIDLDKGAQPLVRTDLGLAITFNGEIYNYQELRAELQASGHAFHTRSDTEVILLLYAAGGIDAFSRLRGMYAFALWDRQRGCGFLARDPLGIKPLFLVGNTDGIVFASEAKAILARDRKAAVLDEGALHLLLNFRYLPGARTLMRGIRQLEPGCVLEWHPDGHVREHAIGTLPTAAMGVREALEDSVSTHMTADVEVGAYLSGGIDSATVVALARRHTIQPLRTFTLNVGDDPLEARNAAATASMLGVVNLQADVPPEAAQGLKRLVWHLELPKVNALQASELARHAARHVKVALSGLGGDELFLGYNIHRWLASAASLHRWSPAALSAGLGGLGAGVMRAFTSVPWSEPERAAAALQALGNWPRVYGLLRNLWDSPSLRRAIYGPRMLDAELPDAWEALLQAWPDEPDPVMAAARFEWRNKMVNDLLWQEDRVSMAVGLEVRVPFVDGRLSACVQRLERRSLMPGNRPKGYMRNMLASLLPAEVLERRKSGFQVDAPRFFHEVLAPLAQQHLHPDRIRQVGLFNPRFVQRVMSFDARKAHRWHFFMLYLMLATHLWIEMFEEAAPGTARAFGEAA